jgi:hypothetical protein
MTNSRAVADASGGGSSGAAAAGAPPPGTCGLPPRCSAGCVLRRGLGRWTGSLQMRQCADWRRLFLLYSANGACRVYGAGRLAASCAAVWHACDFAQFRGRPAASILSLSGLAPLAKAVQSRHG